MIANALKRSDGNINYPGLIAAWSAKGKTNDDADRATLKDLTGNGHDITLNGFSFSEMSGYGGYNYGKGKWELRTMNAYEVYFFNTTPINGNLTFNISGITDFYTKTGNYVQIRYHRKDGGINQYMEIKEDGFYDIDPTTSTTSVGISMRSAGTDTTDAPCNIVLEMIPNYPGALVFDGVDDYGICPQINSNLFTEFTFICKRSYVTNPNIGKNTITANCVSTSNNKNIFSFEGFYQTPYISVYSNNTLSVSGILIDYSLQTTFLTPINYNGINFKNGGDNNYNENAKLNIGRLYNGSRYSNIAFYSAYLFDRSLDEQEIKSFIRKYIDPEYLLPSEIPTPDCYYDFSKGSNDDETRDTIKDYSGNGNDAVAHNFAWSGMSGYGGNLYGNYKYHFDTLGIYQNIVSKTPVIGNLKFKVTGLTDYFNKTTNYIELTLTRVSDGGTDFKQIKEDGEHNIELPTSKYSEISIRSGGINIEDDACNIDIEMLPEYPGALVFDGTDDYVSLDAFDSGFKTMFMVCNPRNKSNAFLYEQRKNTELPYDYGLYTYNSVAYNIRNANGTYINGIKNTKVFTKDSNNKKILISVNSELTQLNKPTISVGITGSYSDMALYKFLGFKEALTEEQIQTVIKKYNLLDGVDEIEVS